jgi:phosphoenolpyruvate synthase/pyruvate phosphate dikinase
MGIDSISLNPDTVLKTARVVLEAELALLAAGAISSG